MMILSCLKLFLTVEHSILYLYSSWEKTVSECVGRVSNLKKRVAMFTRATGILHDNIDLLGCL